MTAERESKTWSYYTPKDLDELTKNGQLHAGDILSIRSEEGLRVQTNYNGENHVPVPRGCYLLVTRVTNSGTWHLPKQVRTHPHWICVTFTREDGSICSGCIPHSLPKSPKTPEAPVVTDALDYTQYDDFGVDTTVGMLSGRKKGTYEWVGLRKATTVEMYFYSALKKQYDELADIACVKTLVNNSLDTIDSLVENLEDDVKSYAQDFRDKIALAKSRLTPDTEEKEK